VAGTLHLTDKSIGASVLLSQARMAKMSSIATQQQNQQLQHPPLLRHHQAPRLPQLPVWKIFLKVLAKLA